jgi:hypothetical protein
VTYDVKSVMRKPYETMETRDCSFSLFHFVSRVLHLLVHYGESEYTKHFFLKIMQLMVGLENAKPVLSLRGIECSFNAMWIRQPPSVELCTRKGGCIVGSPSTIAQLSLLKGWQRVCRKYPPMRRSTKVKNYSSAYYTLKEMAKPR